MQYLKFKIVSQCLTAMFRACFEITGTFGSLPSGALLRCELLVWLATRRRREYSLAGEYRFTGGQHAARNPCCTA